MSKRRTSEINLVDVEGELRGESERAYRIYDGKKTEWVPKSQVEHNDNVFTMPRWLAEEKGFV